MLEKSLWKVNIALQRAISITSSNSNIKNIDSVTIEKSRECEDSITEALATLVQASSSRLSSELGLPCDIPMNIRLWNSTLKRLTWMSPETLEEAKQNLAFIADHFGVHIQTNQESAFNESYALETINTYSNGETFTGNEAFDNLESSLMNENQDYDLPESEWYFNDNCSEGQGETDEDEEEITNCVEEKMEENETVDDEEEWYNGEEVYGGMDEEADSYAKRQAHGRDVPDEEEDIYNDYKDSVEVYATYSEKETDEPQTYSDNDHASDSSSSEDTEEYESGLDHVEGKQSSKGLLPQESSSSDQESDYRPVSAGLTARLPAHSKLGTIKKPAYFCHPSPPGSSDTIKIRNVPRCKPCAKTGIRAPGGHECLKQNNGSLSRVCLRCKVSHTKCSWPTSDDSDIHEESSTPNATGTMQNGAEPIPKQSKRRNRGPSPALELDLDGKYAIAISSDSDSPAPKKRKTS